MSFIDFTNILNRLKKYLPLKWFGDTAPVKDSILEGFAQNANTNYVQYLYSIFQTRIKTSTDIFLDYAAQDFYGKYLKRRSGESDDTFRQRILINLFRERATRNGMISLLTYITGVAPIIFEPWRDVWGGYGISKGRFAYGVKGGMWGSISYPYQAFIIVFRNKAASTAYIGGLDHPYLGYGVKSGTTTVAGPLPWNAYGWSRALISDNDILEAISYEKPIGTRMWVRIINDIREL